MAGGMLTCYAAINDRLRAITLERLDLLRAGAKAGQRDALTVEGLGELDNQVPGLLHHPQQARDAVLAIYAASLVFIGDMFVIALAATALAWLPTLVLLAFPAGIATLFVAVLLIIVEVRISHLAVHYEVQRVEGLSGATKFPNDRPSLRRPAVSRLSWRRTYFE